MIWELLVMMIKQKGQSLLEVIFSVGVLTMVITAVVSLIVKATGLKTMGLQREKASEMSNVVVEQLLENKKNSPDTFWKLTDITTPQTISGYDGYTYTVDFSQSTDGGCSSTQVECANAVVVITWGNNQTFTVTRFFSKKS